MLIPRVVFINSTTFKEEENNRKIKKGARARRIFMSLHNCLLFWHVQGVILKNMGSLFFFAKQRNINGEGTSI